MQIPILIEPIEGDRYRARAGEPFVMSAEGRTKLEAHDKLERMIFERIRAGADLLALEVPLADPRILTTGLAKHNPLWEEFSEVIAENRRRADAANP